MQFLQKRVSILAHIKSENGVEVDQEKVRAVEKMRGPSFLKDLRAFLGLVGYDQKFILDLGKTAEPFYSLLNKSNRFECSAECRAR